MTNPPLEDPRSSLNVPLDIPQVEVEKVETDRDGHYRITVHSTERGTHCHKCGSFITDFYGYSPSITLRHLPILGRQVEICIRPQRYQCQECASCKFSCDPNDGGAGEAKIAYHNQWIGCG